ncbi:MAG: hypothetical protein ACRD12_02325 [Acidimicrobiales bacterium]
MRFRVVSWNVDSRPTGSFDAKLDLLHELEPDIALLRELRRPVYRGFLPHAQAYERLHGRPRLFAWGVLSTDVTDPPAADRRAGSAVLGGATTTRVETIPLGPKAVAVRIALGGAVAVTVGSAQSRRTDDGSSRDPDLGAWVAGQAGPVVLATDPRPAGGVHPARRDHLLVTPDIHVHNVEYLEKEALATGSDYALIVAELEWNEATL